MLGRLLGHSSEVYPLLVLPISHFILVCISCSNFSWGIIGTILCKILLRNDEIYTDLVMSWKALSVQRIAQCLQQKCEI